APEGGAWLDLPGTRPFLALPNEFLGELASARAQANERPVSAPKEPACLEDVPCAATPCADAVRPDNIPWPADRSQTWVDETATAAAWPEYSPGGAPLLPLLMVWSLLTRPESDSTTKRSPRRRR